LNGGEKSAEPPVGNKAAVAFLIYLKSTPINISGKPFLNITIETKAAKKFLIEY